MKRYAFKIQLKRVKINEGRVQTVRFEVGGSYKLLQDLLVNHNNFKVQRFSAWEKFFNELLPFREHSDAIRPKCDAVF